MIFLFLLLISPLRVLTGSPQPSSSSSPQVRRRHGALTMVGWGGVSNVAISSHHPHPHSPSQRPLVLGPAVFQKGLTCTNLHQTYAPFSVSLASPSWEDQGEGNSRPRVQLDRSVHANRRSMAVTWQLCLKGWGLLIPRNAGVPGMWGPPRVLCCFLACPFPMGTLGVGCTHAQLLLPKKRVATEMCQVSQFQERSIHGDVVCSCFCRAGRSSFPPWAWNVRVTSLVKSGGPTLTPQLSPGL